jgi:hypothetical protein
VVFFNCKPRGIKCRAALQLRAVPADSWTEVGLDMHQLNIILLPLALVAVAVGACESDSAPTSPTSPSTTAGQGLVYDSMQPSDTAEVTRLYQSYACVDSFGRLSECAYVWDDFVASATAEVRTVSWQGGYCDPRYQPPPAVTRSYQITFSEDTNGSPALKNVIGAVPLSDSTLSPAQVREEPIAAGQMGCSPDAGSHSYYQYTATLTTPLRAVAGRRYWIKIVVDVGTSNVGWGWRAGKRDNGYSLNQIAGGSWRSDMAFSLSR